jgi:hypothetical protein
VNKRPLVGAIEILFMAVMVPVSVSVFALIYILDFDTRRHWFYCPLGCG